MSQHTYIVWSRLVPTRLLDSWLERLAWVGPERCVVTELSGRKSSRIDIYCDKNSEAKKLKNNFGGNIRQLKSQQWMATQERSFAQVIGRRLCVASDHQSVPGNAKHLPCLIIPAGMAFGTGEHATTGMCLRSLMDHAGKKPSGHPLRVLDAGTGSGILALAAALIGHEVRAFDFDPDSIEESLKNEKANGLVGVVDWQVADVAKYVQGKKQHIVIANLFSTILCKNLHRLDKWLDVSGYMILSGILKDQSAEVEETAQSLGLELYRKKRKGKWVCLELWKPGR